MIIEIRTSYKINDLGNKLASIIQKVVYIGFWT